MENLTIILIAVTNFFLAVVLGVLLFLIYRYLRQSGPAKPQFQDANFHPVIRERLEAAKRSTVPRSELFCQNHPDEPGEVTCAICDRLFCKACFRPFKSMHLCKEHMPLIMRHEWAEVLTIKTSTSDPEDGVRLYDLKKELFRDQGLATYVETHYKINVDHDYIETYLVLFSIKDQKDEVRGLLEKAQLSAE